MGWFTATTRACPPTGIGVTSCSIVYKDALTLAGRLEEAQYALKKMLTYANHGLGALTTPSA